MPRNSRALKEKYGKEYFAIIGRLGGNATLKRQGRAFYSAIGRKARANDPRTTVRVSSRDN